MIQSFKDKLTEDVYHGCESKASRKLPQAVVKATCRKLDMINAAFDIHDLLLPPGNKLEKLRGNYTGWYSIRINDQYRIVFKWLGHDAHDVHIIDYH